MLAIKRITIEYSKDEQFYILDSKLNLITSDGSNRKGKTSLIRFLFWGLGFDVSLTENFSSAYAETSIEFASPRSIKKIRRRGQSIILNTGESATRYVLPVQEDQVLQQLFPGIPSEIIDQLLGFIYFDQDAGYRAWNRNVVTQRLSNDRSYKISIEKLLAEFASLNYKEYADVSRSLEKTATQTRDLTELLKSISDTTVTDGITSTAGVEQLNDQISEKQLSLHRAKGKLNIYSASLKDQKNFDRLLNKLALKVRINGEIFDVTSDVIIRDNHLQTKTQQYEQYYGDIVNTLESDIERLTQDRDVLSSTREDNQLSLFKTVDNYKRIRRLIISTGIHPDDAQAATDDIQKTRKGYKEKFRQKIKNSAAYSEIWEMIVELATKIGLNRVINSKRNGLLDSTIKSSGAERSLVIMVYRLGILKYLKYRYGFSAPLVLDSPASQEMDVENLTLLLKMITSEFPDTQIIVATNQHVDFSFEQTITLSDGVLRTLETF